VGMYPSSLNYLSLTLTTQTIIALVVNSPGEESF
jgi:hypothetical protein